jgi:hypothetical protein
VVEGRTWRLVLGGKYQRDVEVRAGFGAGKQLFRGEVFDFYHPNWL